MNRRGFLRSIVGMAGAKVLKPLAVFASPVVASETVTVTFPKPGTYVAGIDTGEWSQTRIIILKARSMGITTYPLWPYRYMYSGKNCLTNPSGSWYVEKDMRFSRFHNAQATPTQPAGNTSASSG